VFFLAARNFECQNGSLSAKNWGKMRYDEVMRYDDVKLVVVTTRK